MSADKNAFLSTNDPILVVIYDKAEAVETFGEDHLQEYGCHIPEALIERYKKNLAESQEIQKELRVIKDAHDKRNR